MKRRKRPKRSTTKDMCDALATMKQLLLRTDDHVQRISDMERRIAELEQHALRQMPNPVPPIMPPVGIGSPPLPWMPNVSPPWVTPFPQPSPPWPSGGFVWCSGTSKP